MGQPRPPFCLFSFFSNTNLQKTEGFSGIRTWIVGVEDKHADHLTTTTAKYDNFYYNIFTVSWKINNF